MGKQTQQFSFKKIILATFLLFHFFADAQCWNSLSSAGCTLAIKSDGTLWGWGTNSESNLGINTTPFTLECLVPTQISSETDWKFTAAGPLCSYAIKNNGTLWMCGSNQYGNAGNGTFGSFVSDILTFTQVGNDTDWKFVAVHNYSVYAIKNNGTLWRWGLINSNGGNIILSMPVQFGIDTDWKTVTINGKSILAIKNNGTLWGWGDNSHGELGDGTVIARLNPVQIGVDNNWKDIRISRQFEAFSIGLKTDGTMWSWGYNFNGQLGIGSTIDQHSPVQVGTQSWKCINANLTSAIAIKTDGTLWAWGYNYSGEFGNGISNQTVNSPMQIGVSSNWSLLSSESGGRMNPVLKNDGTIWSSGDNAFGSLGIGTSNINSNVFLLSGSPCLIALNDSGTVNTGSNSIAVANVLSNDSNGGISASSTNVILTFISSTNTGINLNTTTGAVSVSSTVPVGTYTLVYQICDVSNLNYCTTATVTITVTAPAVIANPDAGSIPFGIASTPIANVRANDTSYGAVATSTNTTLSFVSSTNSGITLNTTTGAVNVAANVPVGTYTLTYKICAVASPTTCVNGIVTITVVAPQLVANSDSATTMFGVASVPISNVRANDTFNGAVATSTNTTLSFVSSTNAGITLNTAGAVSVAANVPVGTYTLTYKICAIASPTTCVNGIVTITVVASQLVANNDNATTTFGVASIPVSNVRANDTYNGAVATSSNTTLSFVSSTNAGITLNTAGAVSVAANVPVGTYTLTYKICAIASPTTCVNGTVTIIITAPQLVANSNSATTMFGVASTPISNVRANDTYNGAVATSSNTTLSFVSSTNSGITLNISTGAVNVAANVPVGTYTLTYKICAYASPTTCVNGVVTITVAAPQLVANSDSATIIFGGASMPISNVRANDTFNGAVATSSNTTLSFVSSTNAGILLITSTGAINVAANVPVGTYTLTYRICAIASPTTCVNGVVTITVAAPQLVANSDSGTAMFGVAGVSISNVRANDTFNGAVATASNTNLSLVSTTSSGILLNTTTGSIYVNANVPVGTYTLKYRICAISSPTICVIGTVTVIVSPPVLITNPDTVITTFGVNSIPNSSVLSNDTYNGVTAAALINVQLTLVSTSHPGILLSSTSGGVAVHPTTVPPGTYYLVYKICAVNSPSVCTNGTVTINVKPPVLVANPDIVTVQSGVTSTSNINVRSNDTYNGTSAIVQNSILSFVSSSHPGISLNTSYGVITISSTVPAGTYTLIYKICASGSPTTCTNGAVTVKVMPQQLLKDNDDSTNSTSIESFSLMKNTLDDENLIVYPNPSNGIFTINLENVNDKYETIEVYNLLGEKVFSETIDNRANVTIDLSQFSSGYYIARVKSEEKTVQLKLIKQ